MKQEAVRLILRMRGKNSYLLMRLVSSAFGVLILFKGLTVNQVYILLYESLNQSLQGSIP